MADEVIPRTLAIGMRSSMAGPGLGVGWGWPGLQTGSGRPERYDFRNPILRSTFLIVQFDFLRGQSRRWERNDRMTECDYGIERPFIEKNARKTSENDRKHSKTYEMSETAETDVRRFSPMRFCSGRSPPKPAFGGLLRDPIAGTK